MAVPVSENQLLGIIFVLIEKTIGKGRIFSGTYYILLGVLIARTRIFAKAKIILPVLVGTFFSCSILKSLSHENNNECDVLYVSADVQLLWRWKKI